MPAQKPADTPPDAKACVNLFIEPALQSRIKALSKSTGASMSGLARRLLIAGLDGPGLPEDVRHTIEQIAHAEGIEPQVIMRNWLTERARRIQREML